MNTRRILAAAAAAITLGVTAAPAAADWIDDRQANQMRRIEQGWRSGQLTQSEYRNLVDQQKEIARLERILERDGRLSYADRARLNHLLNLASTSIWWEKHDNQNQFNRGNRGWGNGWGRDDGYGRGWGRDYGYGRGWGRDYGYGRGWGREYGNGYGRGYGDHRGDHHYRGSRPWYLWY